MNNLIDDNESKRLQVNFMPSTSSTAAGKSNNDETNCAISDKELNKNTNEIDDHKVKGSGKSYDGAGIKNTQHGVNYQLKLLMLYIVRGLKRKHEFQVATEVKKADNFDDLLFLCEDEIGLLQAKHRLNEKSLYSTITEDQLLSTEGDFSILTYFRSYDRILKEKELQDDLKDRVLTLILITNIDIDKSVISSFEHAPTRLLRNKILDLGTEEEKKTYYIIKKESPLYKKLFHSSLQQGLKQPSKRQAQHFAKAVLNYKNNKAKFDKLFEENREWLSDNVLEVRKEDNTQNIYLTFKDSFLSGSKESVLNYREAFLDAYFSNKLTGEKDTTSVQPRKNEYPVKQYLSSVKFPITKSENKNETPKISKDEMSKFLDIFVFAVKQPNKIRLGDIIENEIVNYAGYTGRESTSSKFKLYIQDWAMQKQGRYLTNKDIEQQFALWGQETFNQRKIDAIKKYKCTFKESNEVIKNLSNFLNTKNEADMLCLYSRETLFSKIKIYQVLESFARKNIDQHFIFCDLNDLSDLENTKNCPVKAFYSQTCNILCVSLQEDDAHNTEVLNRLFQILIESNRNAEKPQSVKRLIISIPEKEKSKFVNKYNLKIKTVNDFENSFKELDEKSKQQLMQKGCIKLHGKNVTGLLSENELSFCIRDEMLLKFISSEIEISKQPLVTDQYNKEVKEYYVNRSIVPVIVNQDVTKDFRFQFVREGTPQTDIENQEVVIVSSNEKLFKRFRKKNNNVHWLQEKNNKFIWITSQGTLRNLRKYVETQNTDLDANSDLDSDSDLNLNFDPDSNPDLGPDLDSNPVPDPDPNREPDNYIKNVSDLKNDLVLITASPGMGKSILLSHIAEQSKKEDISFFVFKANLSGNFKQLDSLNKKENVTLEQAIHFAFITTQIESPQIEEESESIFNLLTFQEDGKISFSPNACFSDLDHLRAMIFCNLYNKEKIVLLLDGFDETAPYYCKQTLNILRKLKDSMVRKIWITTRPCDITKSLENDLETFAYTLKPLSKDEHLTLVKNYWRHNIKSGDTKILSSMQDFLNLVNMSTLSALHKTETKEKSLSFMSVPLHSTMLAKVLTNDFMKFCSPENDIAVASYAIDKPLTIYALYSKFFYIKFDEILYDGKSKDPRYITLLQEKKKKVETELGKLALLEIFDHKLLMELVPDEDRFELLNNVKIGNEKTGIVAEVVDKKPRFVHRTFTEYFAAHYLATIILRPVENKRKEAAKSLLYNSVTGNTEYYFLLFTFFNYIVVSNSENKDFFEAAIVGNFRKLSGKENVNDMFDPLSRTPMHFIAIDIFTVLQNIEKEYKNANLTTSKMHSIFIRHLGYSMIKRCSDTLFRWTPTHYLTLCPCKSNSVYFPALSKYLNDGTQDTFGRTPLILLILNHSSSSQWIKHSLPFNLTCVNTQDHVSKTALHYALKNFHKCVFSEETNRGFIISLWQEYIEIICFLLKHGARIDVPDNQGITPVDMINSVVTKETTHVLKQMSNYQKYKLDEYDRNSINAILKEFIAKHVEKHGYNAFSFEVNEGDTPDPTGPTALQYSVEQKDSNSVNKLINVGARRINSNINRPLIYTILRQGLNEIFLPTSYNTYSEEYGLFFIRKVTSGTPTSYRRYDLRNPWMESDRESFFEIDVRDLKLIQGIYSKYLGR